MAQRMYVPKKRSLTHSDEQGFILFEDGELDFDLNEDLVLVSLARIRHRARRKYNKRNAAKTKWIPSIPSVSMINQ